MRCLGTLCSIFVAAAPASADSITLDQRPPEPKRPAGGSLALPQGKLLLGLTLEIESAAGKLGQPIAIAPDVTYGVTERLSLTLAHSRFATTGLRATTGGGLCFGEACSRTYDNAGAEALLAVRSGPLAVAAVGGVFAMSFDNGFYDLKLGGRVRYTAGRASVIASPSVFLAMTERTDDMGVRRNRDLYFVPVLFAYKVLPALAIGPGTGIKGSLNDLGGTWEFPLGFVATYAIDRRITVGASLIFGKLVGGAEDPPAPAPPATGVDFRGTQLWVVVVP